MPPRALLAAGVLLAILLALAGARWWLDARAAPSVAVLEARVPDAPVAALDRVDLSTRLGNDGARRLEDLTVELTVLGPDGRPALVARQRGVGLDPASRRAVYWGWRVPGSAPAGTYRATVSVRTADGRLVAATSGAGPSFQVRAPARSPILQATP